MGCRLISDEGCGTNAVIRIEAPKMQGQGWGRLCDKDKEGKVYAPNEMYSYASQNVSLYTMLSNAVKN